MIYPIVKYGQRVLEMSAAPITVFDGDLEKLVADMFETMYAAPGVGLAASQIDQHIRLIVIDVSENNDQPLVFINPEVIAADGQPINQPLISQPRRYSLDRYFSAAGAFRIRPVS